MKVIVAGSRSFSDYELLRETLDELLPKDQPVEIVSGHAKGADQLGERYAAERNLPCRVFPADWKKDWKRAGFLRNSRMLDYVGTESALLVAFWNGESHGTRDILQKARERGISAVTIRRK